MSFLPFHRRSASAVRDAAILVLAAAGVALVVQLDDTIVADDLVSPLVLARMGGGVIGSKPLLTTLEQEGSQKWAPSLVDGHLSPMGCVGAQPAETPVASRAAKAPDRRVVNCMMRILLKDGKFQVSYCTPGTL